MFTVKLCRTAVTTCPNFVYKSLPKTFSTLSCFTNQLLHRHGARNYNIVTKLQIKPILGRKASTFKIEKSTSQVKKNVGVWLFTCSGLVYMTIMLGGYTRLTESGLSMVTWRFTYETFPTTEEEWLAEFDKYKEFPEFKLLKKNITLEEFKTIWKTEYFHRYMGRVLGIMYLIPASFFWVQGCFHPQMKKRILFFGLLIGAQGLLGWYMVKSGLEDRFHKESDVPRVSQYRLAAHLGLALTLYTGFLLTALDLVVPIAKLTNIPATARKLRILVHSCKGLVFLTAISGAFVAGLDAGLIYNSFPKMGDRWIPEDILIVSPTLKNFTENPTTVQFDHRILGITTFVTIMATWLLCRRQPLPRRVHRAANVLAIVGIAQVLLGISTLVHYVPTHLAVSHQSGSVLLLTAAIWLSHELKVLKYLPK